MADVQSIDMRDGEIIVSLRISKNEYALLNQETKNLVLLPTSSEILNEILTTGKLGNSNRVMLPKKTLARHHISSLPKKAKAKVFEIDDSAFLLIHLKESKSGVPKFKEAKWTE